jgi:aldehyde dehydrogenase (NAD+)
VFDPQGGLIGQAPIANRKDIRNAVEAARAAKGWTAATAHNRAQVLYYIGENLSARAAEFASLIDRLTGGHSGAAEVDTAVNRLFSYAAWADKFDGAVRSVPLRGVALAMNEPCGVIGALCPDEAPLLGMISVIAPAIAMGNRVVIVASQPFPLAALEFTQVLETSDVPGGVVNILTGSHAELAPTLATHMDIEALWSFSSSDLSGGIEQGSASNLKRTWVNNGTGRDWVGPTGEGRAFLEAATEVKTVWVPYGA